MECANHERICQQNAEILCPTSDAAIHSFILQWKWNQIQNTYSNLLWAIIIKIATESISPSLLCVHLACWPKCNCVVALNSNFSFLAFATYEPEPRAGSQVSSLALFLWSHLKPLKCDLVGTSILARAIKYLSFRCDFCMFIGPP